MSKDTLAMMVPSLAMVVYVIIHFTLWRGQEGKK
jgi:hypothetical protein